MPFGSLLRRMQVIAQQRRRVAALLEELDQTTTTNGKTAQQNRADDGDAVETAPAPNVAPSAASSGLTDASSTAKADTGLASQQRAIEEARARARAAMDAFLMEQNPEEYRAELARRTAQATASDVRGDAWPTDDKPASSDADASRDDGADADSLVVMPSDDENAKDGTCAQPSSASSCLKAPLDRCTDDASQMANHDASEDVDGDGAEEVGGERKGIGGQGGRDEDDNNDDDDNDDNNEAIGPLLRSLRGRLGADTGPAAGSTDSRTQSEQDSVRSALRAVQSAAASYSLPTRPSSSARRPDAGSLCTVARPHCCERAQQDVPPAFDAQPGADSDDSDTDAAAPHRGSFELLPEDEEHSMAAWMSTLHRGHASRSSRRQMRLLHMKPIENAAAVVKESLRQMNHQQANEKADMDYAALLLLLQDVRAGTIQPAPAPAAAVLTTDKVLHACRPGKRTAAS